IIGDGDAGPNNYIGEDGDVPAYHGVPGKPGAGGIAQGDAGLHEVLAARLLEQGLGAGQLAAVVDAHDVDFRGNAIADRLAGSIGQLDQIGQVIFALDVVVIHLVDQIAKNFRPESED